MQTLYGICLDDQGIPILAKVGLAGTTGTLISSEKWKPLHALKLFNSGIHLGLPCAWLRTEQELPSTFVRSKSQSKFSPAVQEDVYKINCEQFSQNLLSTVSDDSFLCTVPVYFSSCKTPSFLSICKKEKTVLIGIILKWKLEQVFSFEFGPESNIGKVIGRIQRYWVASMQPDAFPSHVFVFGDYAPDSLTFKVTKLELPSEFNDLAVLKAAGTALALQEEIEVPSFTFASKKVGFRTFRTAAVLVSVLLIGLGIVGIAGTKALELYYAHQVSLAASKYKALIAGNSSIRNELSHGDSLANRLLDINNSSSHHPPWGRFLDLLSRERPAGLALERLGSEQVQSKTNRIRVALSGWSQTEIAVTDLIKKLKTQPYILESSLAALERLNDTKTICHFKILCTIQLEK